MLDLGSMGTCRVPGNVDSRVSRPPLLESFRCSWSGAAAKESCLERSVMTRPFPVVYLLSLLLLSACASPEDRAARADEEVSQQRLQLIEQHQPCVDEAAGAAQTVDACEVYTREAEALK